MSDLVERLRNFPLFHSYDGFRWYKDSADKEPICLEAADALATLQAENEGLRKALEEESQRVHYWIKKSDKNLAEVMRLVEELRKRDPAWGGPMILNQQGKA